MIILEIYISGNDVVFLGDFLRSTRGSNFTHKKISTSVLFFVLGLLKLFDYCFCL